VGKNDGAERETASQKTKKVSRQGEREIESTSRMRPSGHRKQKNSQRNPPTNTPHPTPLKKVSDMAKQSFEPERGEGSHTARGL